MKTTGDKNLTASLANPGAALPKGLFTKELEVALLDGEAEDRGEQGVRVADRLRRHRGQRRLGPRGSGGRGTGGRRGSLAQRAPRVCGTWAREEEGWG